MSEVRLICYFHLPFKLRCAVTFEGHVIRAYHKAAKSSPLNILLRKITFAEHSSNHRRNRCSEQER